MSECNVRDGGIAHITCDIANITCDQILHDDPNAKIVIAGDINQLNIKDLM